MTIWLIRKKNKDPIRSAELNSKKKKTIQHSDRRLQVWPGQAIYDIVAKHREEEREDKRLCKKGEEKYSI